MKKYLIFFLALLLQDRILIAQQASNDKRPNIIFMMSDDHAYQAISAYDKRLIQTPNIDRIASRGMLFTNASVANSICRSFEGYHTYRKTLAPERKN